MKRNDALQIMEWLDKGTNIFGPLHPEIRARLYAVAEHPTPETWEEAYSIIISAEHGLTLWQALIRYGHYEVTWRGIDEPWPVVPTRTQILGALNMVLS